MFAVVILGTLLFILIVFVASIVYLVALVVHEAGDYNSRGPSLGIDAHDFNSLPVISPNDNLADYYETTTSNSASNQSRKSSGGSDRSLPLTNPNGSEWCYCTRRQKALALKMLSIQNEERDVSTELITSQGSVIQEPVTADELHSAMLNSQILNLSEKQRISSNDDSSNAQKPIDLPEGVKSKGPISEGWQMSTGALKELITVRMGAMICKQIFDDFDAKDMQLGGNALHWCKTRKSLDKLIKLGIPLELRNKKNETAVHVAVRKHKLQVLIGLLCYQAKIEVRNDNGETPLILACKINEIFACQLLLIFDADSNAVDKLGYSARHYAASICEKHNNAQQAPSAAHLILAMLNEIGALRCPANLNDERTKAINRATNEKDQPDANETKATHSLIKLCVACTSGCSNSGQYNGNSYNRWSNYSKECLYKKYLFTDLIESRSKASKFSRVWRWTSSSNLEPRSRLLSIDGGGLRGIIVCQILVELEKHLKRPLIDYFDWIGGTSVGAFLACALCQGITLNELRRICFDFKDEVFNGQRPYQSKFIERVLKRTFGTKARMSDIKGKRLAVTTTLADRDPCQLRFFRSYKSPAHLLESHGYASEEFNNMSAHSTVTSRIIKNDGNRTRGSTNASKNSLKEIVNSTDLANERFVEAVNEQPNVNSTNDNDDIESVAYASSDASSQDVALSENDTDPLLWQAVRASAAAPFFFKPYGPFMDGGMISNNPTLDLLGEFESYQKVRDFLRKKSSKSLDDELPHKLDLVVSLGTGRGRVIGRRAMIDFGQVASGFATVFSPVELVRSIRAARDLFKKLMQQSCHTEDHILDRAQAWCSSLGAPYFRINPPLATTFSIDDKRDEQLINAMWQTKLYMKTMTGQLKELAHILDETN